MSKCREIELVSGRTCDECGDDGPGSKDKESANCFPDYSVAYRIDRRGAYSKNCCDVCLCSVTVHLHLNRYRCALVLPYPKQPGESRGSGPDSLKVLLERRREGIVDVERRLILDDSGDHAEVDLGGDLIRIGVELLQFAANHVAIEVDRRDALYITGVTGLVAVCIKPVPAAAVRDDLLGSAKVVHALERGGKQLTLTVQADLCVDIDIERGFSLADRSGELLLLRDDVHEKAYDVCDVVIVVRFRLLEHRLVFDFRHDLVPYVGGLRPRDVLITAEDGLCLCEQRLQPVLITKSFFQIHSKTLLGDTVNLISSPFIIRRQEGFVIEPVVHSSVFTALFRYEFAV